MTALFSIKTLLCHSLLEMESMPGGCDGLTLQKRITMSLYSLQKLDGNVDVTSKSLVLNE